MFKLREFGLLVLRAELGSLCLKGLRQAVTTLRVFCGQNLELVLRDGA